MEDGRQVSTNSLLKDGKRVSNLYKYELYGHYLYFSCVFTFLSLFVFENIVYKKLLATSVFIVTCLSFFAVDLQPVVSLNENYRKCGLCNRTVCSCYKTEN